jgi:hypothetical protein
MGEARGQSGNRQKGDEKTREERLAARLRENLKRRKAQARALGEQVDAASPGPSAPEGAEASAATPRDDGLSSAPSTGADALPKPPQER